MVSIATLTTSTWDAVYNFLQTGTYALTTNNIYSAYNDRLLVNTALPIVIVYHPSISISEVNKNIRYAKISFTIEIYHKTAENLKSVTDELLNKFMTGYAVFEAISLKKARANWIETLDYSSWESGENHRIHRNTLAINFKYVGV
jgi:hypothetical protein